MYVLARSAPVAGSAIGNAFMHGLKLVAVAVVGAALVAMARTLARGVTRNLIASLAALVVLLTMFAPGLLLPVAVLPAWSRIGSLPAAAAAVLRAMAGA